MIAGQIKNAMAKKMIQDQTPVRLIGYARVSTVDQNPRMQRDALLAYGVLPDDIYEEKKSARANKRPELETAIAKLREGDKLVVWKLDRFCRSIRDLYALLERIREAGATFVSLTENIDISTPSGRFMLGLFGLQAEFEREIISERTTAGIAAAMARGQTFGRKLIMTPEKLDQAEAMLLAGESSNAVAKALKIKRGLIYRHFRIEKGDDGYVYVTRKLEE